MHADLGVDLGEELALLLEEELELEQVAERERLVVQRAVASAVALARSTIAGTHEEVEDAVAVVRRRDALLGLDQVHDLAAVVVARDHAVALQRRQTAQHGVARRDRTCT